MNPVWPLNAPPLMPDEPGCFGVFRKSDRHTGVDLYCELGTEVVACEDGIVRVIEPFTGPTAESPWWNDTVAVLIEDGWKVSVYGEISRPLVTEGQQVKRGQVIGVIDRPVLKSNKGRPMVMLHFERMHCWARKTLWWKLGEQQPQALLDPTDYLLKAAGPNVAFFKLDEYDGKRFIDPSAPKKSSPWWSHWGVTGLLVPAGGE